MFRRSLDWLSYHSARIFTEEGKLTPPRRLINNIGGGDFHAEGEELFGHFTREAGLSPGERILDIGCGCGRLAVPLTRYLTTGYYRGFDIDEKAIRWSASNITRRFPNFRFEHANVFNKVYNRFGTVTAAEYRFPYTDGEFDFVCLTSVFTHMLWDDLAHYLREIARVTKPGGRCFVTFFLLNDGSRRAIAQGKSKLTFRFESGKARLESAEKPEWAVAYDQADMERLFAEVGLRIAEPIRFGRWCGRENSLSYQDVVIANQSAVKRRN